MRDTARARHRRRRPRVRIVYAPVVIDLTLDLGTIARLDYMRGPVLPREVALRRIIPQGVRR